MVATAIQDVWLDYYNSLAEYQTNWIKRETLTIERVESLSAKVLELSGHVYKLLTKVTAFENATPPTTEDMKAIVELRDMVKDLPRRLNPHSPDEPQKSGQGFAIQL